MDIRSRQEDSAIQQLEISPKDPLNSSQIDNVQYVEGRVAVMALSTWFFGYTLTQISMIHPVVWFYSFGIDMTQQIYVGFCLGLVPFGASLGFLIFHLTKNLTTRKNYLIICCVLGILFTGCLQIGGVPCLFVFRTLQGVVAGINLPFIHTFIKQFVPKRMYPRLTHFHTFGIVTGVMTSYITGMAINSIFGFENLPMKQPETIIIDPWKAQVEWRVTFAIAAVPSIFQLFLCLTDFIPEVPSKLEKINTVEVQDNAEVPKQRQVASDIDIKWTKKGYLLGFELAIFLALTGAPSYITQTGRIFGVVLMESAYAIYAPPILASGLLTGSLLSIPLQKCLDQKTIILMGGLAISLLNAWIGIFIHFYKTVEEFKYVGMVLVVFGCTALLFTFGLTVGWLTMLYASMIVPEGTFRWAQFVNSILSGAAIVAMSVIISSEDNPEILCWVYAGSTFIFTVFNAIFLIKIKGLTIAQIQNKLAKND